MNNLATEQPAPEHVPGPHTPEQHADKLWEQQQRLLYLITKRGGFAPYFDSLESQYKEQGFLTNERPIVVCIDEGCCCDAHTGDNPELNLAGSGILYSVEDAAEMLAPHNPSVITSHDGCGAANLANKDAQAFVKKLVDYLHKHHGMDVAHEHLCSDRMQRDNTLHEAVAVYYNTDGDVLFDASRVKDANDAPLLPKGFTIDAGALGEENGLRELDVAINIALGDHGFGSRFDHKHPFHVVLVGNDNDQKHKTAVENFLNEQSAYRNGKIVIDKIMR